MIYKTILLVAFLGLSSDANAGAPRFDAKAAAQRAFLKAKDAEMLAVAGGDTTFGQSVELMAVQPDAELHRLPGKAISRSCACLGLDTGLAEKFVCGKVDENANSDVPNTLGKIIDEIEAGRWGKEVCVSKDSVTFTHPTSDLPGTATFVEGEHYCLRCGCDHAELFYYGDAHEAGFISNVYGIDLVCKITPTLLTGTTDNEMVDVGEWIVKPKYVKTGFNTAPAGITLLDFVTDYAIFCGKGFKLKAIKP